MKDGFLKINLFGRKKKNEKLTEEDVSQSSLIKTSKGAKGMKKRPQTIKSKKMLPFFRKIRIWATITFLFIFLLSLLGHISFSTIDASLSKGADASLPLNVKEVRNEYTSIKNNYNNFDFARFKKLFGQGAKGPDRQEDELWGKLAETFFGNEHLKYMKAAVEKAGSSEISPEEAGIQTPQITVSGMSMKNDKEMVISLAFNGRQETWLMVKKGGRWTTESLPVEYVLIDAKPDARNEIPYFEIGLRTAPELRWKVHMANTAVKTEGRLASGPTQEVVSEMSQMRTAGSYIMVNDKGKLRYVNMAPPAADTGKNVPASAPGSQSAVSRGGNIINVSGEQMDSMPPEIQRIIESIPVEMPVTSPNGKTGTLKTTVDVTGGAETVSQQGISNVQQIVVPSPPEVQDAVPEMPQVPESIPYNN